MYDIIPGILEKDFAEIEKKIDKVLGFAKVIHIDVIDKQFAVNTTILDPKPFAKYSQDVILEAHLMVEEPIGYLDSFAASGFKRFLGHIEKMASQEEFVAKGQLLGEVGLAIDSPTSLDTVTVSLDDLDAILLMSVKAGESGQTFLPQTLEKIKKIRAESEIKIEIDGGINETTLTQSLECGANRFVTTSFLFKGDPLQNYQKLHSLLKTNG